MESKFQSVSLANKSPTVHHMTWSYTVWRRCQLVFDAAPVDFVTCYCTHKATGSTQILHWTGKVKVLWKRLLVRLWSPSCDTPRRLLIGWGALQEKHIRRLWSWFHVLCGRWRSDRVNYQQQHAGRRLSITNISFSSSSFMTLKTISFNRLLFFPISVENLNKLRPFWWSPNYSLSFLSHI